MIFQLLWKKWKTEFAELCTDQEGMLISLNLQQVVNSGLWSFSMPRDLSRRVRFLSTHSVFHEVNKKF